MTSHSESQLDWVSGGMSCGWEPSEHARRTDHQTSHDAAMSMRNEAPSLLEVLYLALHTYGPSTYTELARHTGLQGQQVEKRLSDLLRAKRIAATGITRPGPSGRQQTVWTALPPNAESSDAE